VSIVGACACLPLTTAGTNVFLALAILFWLASGRVGPAVAIVRTSRVAAFALLLLALLIVSAAYSSAPLSDQLDALAKARKLLYIPITASLFEDDAWWRRCLIALALAILVAIGVAFCLHWGLLGAAIQARLQIGGDKAAFKDYIVHGWFGALLVYGAVAVAALSWSNGRRLAALAIAAIGALDILFFEQGRTGAVALFVLVPLAAAMHFGRRGLAAATALGVGAVAALLSAQNPLAARMKDSIQHARAYLANPESEATSVGVRLAFYRYGLELIADSPVLGHGLGSIATEYGRLTSGHKGNTGTATANPHNEFINLGVQAGLGATALYALLLLAIARHSLRLAEPERSIGVGLAVLMSISSLFNSSLWNFSEGFALAILAGLLIARPGSQGGSRPAPSGKDSSQRSNQDLHVSP
jgi:O-antigen ligase